MLKGAINFISYPCLIKNSCCSSVRCEDPSLYTDPEDMITVAHLYCVSLAFRLAIGGVSLAISSGLSNVWYVKINSLVLES